jgi:NAD(P)-dependent dehydrogenase (short-subunit alcohol dehydrogenase family)
MAPMCKAEHPIRSYQSYEQTYAQFETNFFGAMRVTHCILPHFRKARSGVILFMGSIAGWVEVGASGPYSTSKFALEGKSLTLDVQIRCSC